MVRFRKINRATLRCPELEGVSLEAEHLALKLPLACDDFGRARLDFLPLCEQLFPNHPDAYVDIVIWYGELEKSGFVTHYSVGETTYLQLVRWDEDQRIKAPRPSHIPPPFAPSASPGEVGEAGTHDGVEQGAGSPGDPPSDWPPSAGDEAASPPPETVGLPVEPLLEPTVEPPSEPVVKSVQDYLAQLWGTVPAGQERHPPARGADAPIKAPE